MALERPCSLAVADTPTRSEHGSPDAELVPTQPWHRTGRAAHRGGVALR